MNIISRLRQIQQLKHRLCDFSVLRAAKSKGTLGEVHRNQQNQQAHTKAKVDDERGPPHGRAGQNRLQEPSTTNTQKKTSKNTPEQTQDMYPLSKQAKCEKGKPALHTTGMSGTLTVN